jgi:cytochrome c-type biogenesis protein CcmH/NrfG
MQVRIAWLLLFSLTAAAAPIDEPVALLRAKKSNEAESRLRQMVAADPTSATACYYLGMTLRAREEAKDLEEAAVWLKKAAELEPNNADYLADYGGTELLLAQQNNSLIAAVRGRDAMEKALRLDPSDTDTRQALFEFYVQAPWPLGSAAKASAKLEEIRQRDPPRAAALSVRMKTEAKDFDGAFAACDALLAANLNNYAALYEYGWCAAVSGRNLERGLLCLQRALTLTPPSPASPAPTKIWCVIGDVQTKAGRMADARAAYQTALRLDPTNTAAVGALAKIKS